MVSGGAAVLNEMGCNIFEGISPEAVTLQSGYDNALAAPVCSLRRAGLMSYSIKIEARNNIVDSRRF